MTPGKNEHYVHTCIKFYSLRNVLPHMFLTTRLHFVKVSNEFV